MRTVLLALALALAPVAGFAQRAPGAPDAAAIRASIASLQAQRSQWQIEASRTETQRRELEQQLERVRRELQVLDQRLATADRQLRDLEAALAQAQ